ncbi:MAG: RNase adapter RapZ [Lactobacillales bacterium]|nr:RNase adapter RapZ [Lactobacillales bacterium]
MNEKHLVIVSGMSGAGKTVAIQAFEDMGYFCIDNLPPTMLKMFFKMIQKSNDVDNVAVVIDVRARMFFEEISSVLADLENAPNIKFDVLFLDANDDELVARYKETRRNHPLAENGLITVGIEAERVALDPLKKSSQIVIDTSGISPRQLREELGSIFKKNKESKFHVEVVSFGYKYGLPKDADIVMDVRFLPNPHYIPELRPLTGNDEAVRDFVMSFDETQIFYAKFLEMIEMLLPAYIKEGKTSLTIAIGCTGGQHRSVAIANRLYADVLERGYIAHNHQRDAGKRKETVNRS